jgi:hypothetical protein
MVTADGAVLTLFVCFSLVFLKSEKNNIFFISQTSPPQKKTLVFRSSLAGGLGS